MKRNVVEQHFHDLLLPLFPGNATFVAVSSDSDGVKFRIDWRTPTTERPNKHSRPIVLHVTRELLEDYKDANNDAFPRRDDLIVAQHVRARLAAFDPNHNVPSRIPVPEDVWVLGPSLID
jgi:hypothetical protein